MPCYGYLRVWSKYETQEFGRFHFHMMKVHKKLFKHMKFWEVFYSIYNFVTCLKVYYHHAYTTGTYICSHVCSFDLERGIKEKSLREGLKIFGCASDQ